jgi:hypothetical protein
MIKPDDPAFPVDIRGISLGLTKREYFAAVIAQGFAANGSYGPPDLASEAVDYADALIAELAKEKR